MDWINLHVSVLDSSDFLGEDPVNRATWLCVLKFCVFHENSGKIENCREWKSRKFQQILGITRREILKKSALWHWDGNDLHIHYYPIDKELAVKAKREAGKLGGRPRQTEQEPYGFDSDNQNKTEPESKRETEGEGEKETLTSPYSPPSEFLVKAATPVLGVTADATLLHWMTLYDEGWIVEALALTERKKNLNGNAASYCKAILDGWKKNGKEKEHDNPARANGSNHRKGSGEAGTYLQRGTEQLRGL